jgi:hypothetical protein
MREKGSGWDPGAWDVGAVSGGCSADAIIVIGWTTRILRNISIHSRSDDNDDDEGEGGDKLLSQWLFDSPLLAHSDANFDFDFDFDERSNVDGVESDSTLLPDGCCCCCCGRWYL